jgi:uncharacterized protein (TIGR03435 family)
MQNGGGGMMSSSSSSSSASSQSTVKKRSMNSQNQSIPVLIKNLQGYYDKPILDQTGLTGKYDVTMEVTVGDGESEGDAIKRALLGQLGLELAPSQEKIERLVVEKVK